MGLVWKGLREATAAASVPALLRAQTDNPGDNDADDEIRSSGPGDGDADDTTCPTCSGDGIDGGMLCPECGGSGSVMKESDKVNVCSVCLTAECDVEGTEQVQWIREAVLTAKARKAIPRSKFAIPSKAPGPGSYPIHDRAHAIAALSRSSGKPEEATVKAEVYKAYPDLKKDTKEASDNFGGKKAPPFGGKTKESEEPSLIDRMEALEKTVGVFKSLKEAKPASMTAAFSTPTRVKTSDGRDGYAVILIREGKGNSDDDQWYTADAVRELCESGICEGMQAYGNHPTGEEEEERPERDVKELVGTYHDVKFAESGGVARADAIFVPLTLDEKHPRYGWVVTLAEAAIRNTSQRPICGISLYGLSAGDDMDRPDGSHGRVVDLIRPQSGDIVTNAGAGGGFIRQLMESARARRNRSEKELSPMKAMAYQSAVREAAKRVREATTDDERTKALEELDALEGETIDNVPDTIDQLREAAPKLFEDITTQVTAEVKESDSDVKVENEQLRTQLREAQKTLGGLTDAIGITEALREAGVDDPLEIRHYAREARRAGLREAKDIKEMVEDDKALREQRRKADLEAMREALFPDGDTDDFGIEGVPSRVPALAVAADGGIEELREAGIPILDAE